MCCPARAEQDEGVVIVCVRHVVPLFRALDFFVSPFPRSFPPRATSACHSNQPDAGRPFLSLSIRPLLSGFSRRSAPLPIDNGRDNTAAAAERSQSRFGWMLLYERVDSVCR